MQQDNRPIGGKALPKWIVPDMKYVIGDQEFDIMENWGRNSQHESPQIVPGLCMKCRNIKKECICNYGQ